MVPDDADTNDLPPDGRDAGGISQRLGRVIGAHRAAQGRSLSDLARAAGLSKTILARIERGEGNPSIETLWRISRALSLPLGALIGDEERPRVRATKARTGARLRAESGMTAWLLHAEGRGHHSELFELELPAGVDQRTGPHLPGTEELVVCVTGRVLVGPYGEEVELAPGDAVWFQADVDHHYVGLEDARAHNLILYLGAGAIR